MKTKRLYLFLLWAMVCTLSAEVMVMPIVLENVPPLRKIYLTQLMQESLPDGYKLQQGSGLKLEAWLLEITGLPKESVVNTPESIVIPMGYYQIEGTQIRCFLSGMMIQLKPKKKILKIVNLEKTGSSIENAYTSLFKELWEKMSEKPKEEEMATQSVLLYYQRSDRKKAETRENPGLPEFMVLSYISQEMEEQGLYKLTVPDLYSQEMIKLMDELRRGGSDTEAFLLQLSGKEEKPDWILGWNVDRESQDNMYGITIWDVQARAEKAMYVANREGKELEILKQSKLIANAMVIEYMLTKSKCSQDERDALTSKKLTKSKWPSGSPAPLDIHEVLQVMEQTGELQEVGVKMMCGLLLDIPCTLKQAV